MIASNNSSVMATKISKQALIKHWPSDGMNWIKWRALTINQINKHIFASILPSQWNTAEQQAKFIISFIYLDSKDAWPRWEEDENLKKKLKKKINWNENQPKNEMKKKNEKRMNRIKIIFSWNWEKCETCRYHKRWMKWMRACEHWRS